MNTFPNIALDGVKYRSEALKMDAQEMLAYVSILNAVPDFHTLAESYLEEADKALAEAVHAVAQARARFESLRGK